MATWGYIDFSRPEAQRLADLTGVEFDLRSTAENCELFLAKDVFKASHEETRIMRALCIAAVVSYGRAFATGVRSGITPEQLARLPDNLQEAHEFFIDFRNKFVAHSVNALEENSVKAYLVPEERGPRAVSSISVSHARVVMLSANEVAALRDLVNSLIEVVVADARVENQKVLEYARSLPVDPLYEAKPGPPFDPRNISIRSSRGKFK